MSEKKEVDDGLTMWAINHRLRFFSMYLWEACCLIHGVGGTPKSCEMYKRILEIVKEEYEQNK